MLSDAQIPLVRLFSAKHEFPSKWHRFLHPKDTDSKQTLQLSSKPERFPFQFRGKNIEINAAEMFLKLKEGFEYDDGHPLAFDLLKKMDDDTDEPLAEGIGFEIAGSPIENLSHAETVRGSDRKPR